MPRTKKRPATTPKPVALNGPMPGEVLTLTEAAAYLRLPEEEVVRLAEMQDLPGRLAGTEWRFLKTAIQQWLSTSALRSNKEAWIALAGSCKDDPDLEGIVEEAYRRRGRPITEDGSYKNFSR
jgi:excisionase family DNA binding protein